MTDTALPAVDAAPTRNFDPTAKLFHWAMAAIIIVASAVGWYGASLHYGVSPEQTAQKVWAITLHKSIATTTLFLIVGRLIWRFGHKPPALGAMPEIMKHLTHVGHWLLYALMVAVPLSGWANSSSAGYDIPVAGLFTIPRLMAKTPELTPWLVWTHWLLSWALILTVAGHVLFALKHHFVDRDDTIRAMMPKH